MKIQQKTRVRPWFGRRIIPVICLAALVSTNPVAAFANGFLLAPTRLIFEGPGRSQELTIMNQSDKPQTYRLRVEDRRLKEDGQYDLITDNADPTVASPMLRLSVRQISIPPRSSSTVRVLLRKPIGQAAGEVRSHLVVTELPVVNVAVPASEQNSEITVSITTIFGISIPVLVRTGETSARIATVTKTRVVRPDNPQLESVVVRAEATGTRSMFLDVRLVSTRNRRATPIAQARSFALYAPLGPRILTLSLDAEQTAKLRAGNVVLQYQEVNRDGAPIGAVTEIAF